MKIEEQVLSIEQMKHLQELGVDTSDTSMAYYNISRYNQPDKWILGFVNKEVATVMLSNGITEMEPTYTIGDLIEKLPKDVRNYDLEIHCDFNCLGYAAVSDFEYSIEYDRLIDGLYDLLCWVAENHKELLDVKK